MNVEEGNKPGADKTGKLRLVDGSASVIILFYLPFITAYNNIHIHIQYYIKIALLKKNKCFNEEVYMREYKITLIHIKDTSSWVLKDKDMTYSMIQKVSLSTILFNNYNLN